MKSTSICFVMATIAGALSAEVDIDRLCPPRAETAARYEAGAYPAAVRPYRDAALAVYRYMTSLPAMTTLVETGKPNQKYQHNAYVSKTHAAHIEAMLEWARADPSQRETAMRFAKASAEYLLGELEPADAPLAWWPPTYGRKPLEFDPTTDGPYEKPAMIGNEPAGAVKYRGEVMLVYPSDVGFAFLEYYGATKDGRFLLAAKGIGETYLRTRRPDGSWPLKMKLSTGEAIGENTLVPDRTMLFFEALYAATGDTRWRQAEEAAFAWLEAHPLSDWNWDGQFEDIKPAKPYQNPTKHNAIETMMYILRRFPGDKARLATCRKLLDFCEKRFVVWKTPPNYPNWPAPSVLEQYSCFTPIDSSVSKMIRGYLAMYRAEGRAEDYEKAKALGNMLTRIQKPTGRIPTFWDGVNTGDSGLSNERYDWLNCMAYSAKALLELAELEMLDPAASGRRNRIALQAMLDRGGVVRVDRPGRYKISGTVFIGSNTTLACVPGVVFVKTDEEGEFSHVICNRGARTKTYDENIEIRGLEIAVNGMDVCDWSVAYGLRGQLAFFYAKNVKVKDFKCLDLGRGQFGLHFCTFENVVVEGCDIRGWKDGVHFGRGSGFRVSRCTFDTGDDPIALNAHDYATSNPELGWISEGVVEDCHDLRNPEKTVGYFCRILAGSWGEWKPGMSVRQSDSVIRPSGVYRVSMQPDGRTFTSSAVPESKPGEPNADGIVWRKVQNDPVTSCGVSNIVFRNLQLDQPRPLFSFHADDDKYSRSCYPGTSIPAQTGIRFENVKVGFTEPKEAFLFKTPVAGLEFIDCDFGNCIGVPTEATGLIDL